MNNNVDNFCDNDNETKQVSNTTLTEAATESAAIRVDVINNELNDNDYVRQYHGYSCWSQIKQRIHQSHAHSAVWWWCFISHRFAIATWCIYSIRQRIKLWWCTSMELTVTTTDRRPSCAFECVRYLDEMDDRSKQVLVLVISQCSNRYMT